MFRGLIEQLSGLRSDEMNHRGCEHDPPTCKTHWPAYDRHTDVSKFPHFAGKGIMLIRNPKAAMPSWFNWRWENQRKLPTHSQIAPVGDWVKWRDQMFGEELENWERMFLVWKGVSTVNISLYIPYEELTQPDAGPLWLERVYDLIRSESPGTPLVSETEIACIWQHVVRGAGASKTKRSGERYSPPYTLVQKNKLLATLDNLLGEFADDNPQLVETLQMYRQDIDENLTVDA